MLLETRLDQPFVDPARAETELKLLVRMRASDDLLAAASASRRSAHFVLCLDLSSSMGDAELQLVREASCAIVDQLRADDVLSVIGFHSVVYDLATAAPLHDAEARDAVKRRIWKMMDLRGGGTDIAYALERAGAVLRTHAADFPLRRVVLLTDGNVHGREDPARAAAGALADEGAVLDGLGFGAEFDFGFVQELAALSNGTAILVERVHEIRQIFRRRARAAGDVVATRARLSVTFTPAVRAGRAWRYSPQIAWIGAIRLPGEIREVSVPLGDLSASQEQALLFTFTLPRRDVGRMRAVRLALRYAVPWTQEPSRERVEDVIVEITDDPARLAEFHGDVERAFDEVEIARMAEALEHAMSRGDSERAHSLFDALAGRYETFGDAVMRDHYLQLRARYRSTGAVSQVDLNTNRYRATQKRESGAKLVNAADLI